MKIWEQNCYNMSLCEAQKLAKSLNFQFYFDWDSCRTEEGYYQVEGSVAFCVKRAAIFSDYADMIWMETPTPDLQVA